MGFDQTDVFQSRAGRRPAGAGLDESRARFDAQITRLQDLRTGQVVAFEDDLDGQALSGSDNGLNIVANLFRFA